MDDWSSEKFVKVKIFVNMEKSLGSRFEVFMAMKIQVVILWIVTPCSDISVLKCHHAMPQPRSPNLEVWVP
jgi:hypothetical protein